MRLSALSMRQISSPSTDGSSRSSTIRSRHILPSLGQRFFARRNAANSIAFLGQVVVDQFQQIFLVIDDEDSFASHDASLGGRGASQAVSPENGRVAGTFRCQAIIGMLGLNEGQIKNLRRSALSSLTKPLSGHRQAGKPDVRHCQAGKPDYGQSRHLGHDRPGVDRLEIVAFDLADLVQNVVVPMRIGSR